MEKKGEIFNQLAIIADLLENANLESTSKRVVFDMEEPEFIRMFDKIIKKTKTLDRDMLQNTFSIKIDQIDFVFTLAKS